VRECALVLNHFVRVHVDGFQLFLAVLTLVVTPTHVRRFVVHNISEVVGRAFALPNH
jgi:hypothetical protein